MSPTMSAGAGTSGVVEIPIAPLPLARLASVLDPAAAVRLRTAAAAIAELPTRLWTVNSTASGGGVAEMLSSLLSYARGAGVDVRWMVLQADPEFFAITKRIHNMLHDQPGDGGRLGAGERALYERTCHAAARDLAERVSPGEIVLLHDPQTAGMASALAAQGVHVMWRSHVGTIEDSPLVHEAWDFLLPYVTDVELFVFSSSGFVPPALRERPVVIVHPSIDPFSPKNQPLSPTVVRGILSHVGLVADGAAEARSFQRQDGTPGRVERFCEVLRTGPPPRLSEPLVVQVSRWDRLKDPIGVLRGFCEHVLDEVPAQLVLAGPNVSAVTDDPEGAEVLAEVEAFWRTLPQAERSRVQLACLPMHDIEENGAIVNALQRAADVVVQKSIEEGFGLTVTEAMWKERAVVAGRVGGIPEQMVDGRDGCLVDPADLPAFGRTVADLLLDPERRLALGRRGRQTVVDGFLHDRHLLQFADMLRTLVGASPPAHAPDAGAPGTTTAAPVTRPARRSSSARPASARP